MRSSLQLGMVVGFVAVGMMMGGCGAAADASGSSEEDPSLVSSEANKTGGTGGSSGGGSSSKKITYLALGDSIAFGMDPLNTTPANPASYIGYPEAVKTIVAANKKANATVDLANAGCPGETSGSFLSTAAADNGCRNWKAAYSLHTNYETTQIAFLESYLPTHPQQFVSIDIGANDLLIVQNTCVASNPTNPLPCIQAALPGALSAYGQNLGQIYARIKAKTTAKIVAVNLYATNYLDTTVSVPAITALNGVLSQVTTSAAVGGVVVDAFTVFKNAAGAAGDACAAGLLIKKPDGTCDIHPSPKGRDLIANEGIKIAKML